MHTHSYAYAHVYAYIYTYIDISFRKKDIFLAACCLGHAVQIERQVQAPGLSQTECP